MPVSTNDCPARWPRPRSPLSPAPPSSGRTRCSRPVRCWRWLPRSRAAGYRRRFGGDWYERDRHRTAAGVRSTRPDAPESLVGDSAGDDRSARVVRPGGGWPPMPRLGRIVRSGRRLTQVAEGVLVHQSEFMRATPSLWAAASCSSTGADRRGIACLVGDLSELGQPVVAGFSTHPHWDHLLWHADLGGAARYGTARCPATIQARLADPHFRLTGLDSAGGQRIGRAISGR